MSSVSDERIARLLRNARSIAVLGAGTDRSRPSYYVPAYLHRNGYQIYPVNPNHEGEELYGVEFVSTLSALEAPVDIVDVFRRPENIPGHLDDLLAMEPRPGAVWFQLGIRNDEAARELERAGMEVVQDRCMLIEHRTLQWESAT